MSTWNSRARKRSSFFGPKADRNEKRGPILTPIKARRQILADLFRKIAPYAAYCFLQLIGLTSRIRIAGREHDAKARKAGGYIYALWHQRQVFFSYTHRGADCHGLISRSRDGDIIARILQLFGLGTVRGSSSRSGSRAMRDMLKLLDDGDGIAITPDGPKGPAREVKSGVLYIALRSGRPIIPAANAVSRHFELSKSWDRLHVPLPLSRVSIVYGAPIYVKSEEDFERAGSELKESLDRVTTQADRLVSGAAVPSMGPALQQIPVLRKGLG